MLFLLKFGIQIDNCSEIYIFVCVAGEKLVIFDASDTIKVHKIYWQKKIKLGKCMTLWST